MLPVSPQHYKSYKVRQYLEKHKHILIPVWLPTVHGTRRILEHIQERSTSIFLLSADNTIYKKHLLDFKDHIVRPVISYLNENSIEIYIDI
jgi:hypothetical protein